MKRLVVIVRLKYISVCFKLFHRRTLTTEVTYAIAMAIYRDGYYILCCNVTEFITRKPS